MKYVGHNAQPTRPRKGMPTKAAMDLVRGDRVRVRYFDYGPQKDVTAFAVVNRLLGATACAAMRAVQPWRVVFVLDCYDDHERVLRPSADRLVEVA